MKTSDGCLSSSDFRLQTLSAVCSCLLFNSIVLFLILFSPLGFSDSPTSFSQAKRIAVQLFSDKRETLYCACRFNENNQVDLKSCQMHEAAKVERARRIEWEHMMPAQHFGKHFQCWNEKLCESKGTPYKGRKCCSKIDPVFKHIEAELYNLWPAVGVINQARSNYPYAMLNIKKKLYGCQFSADKKKRKVEPRDEVKGLVARANLFISYHYNIPLEKEQRHLFELWHAQYPPSQRERQWAKEVAEIEGYHNPYIK